MPRPTLAVIAAVARNGAIGKGNALLVHLPQDLPRFKRLTLGCPVIMGRNTWESIGRPLPGRRNIVVTRNAQWHAAGAEAAPSLAAAMAMVHDAPRVFAIGGEQVFAEALPLAEELHLTEIHAEFDADTFFPPWPRDAFDEVAREPQHDAAGLKFDFVTYHRKRSV